MSNNSASTSPCPEAGQEAASFDWLLALLREAMVEVMADDTPPLKKANALARLGSLYLKTYGAAELKRANAELLERVAEFEERLAAAEGERTLTAEEAAGQAGSESAGSTAARRIGEADHSKPGSHGKLCPTEHRPVLSQIRPAAAGAEPMLEEETEPQPATAR